jgi:hypothetical protein
VHALYHNKEQPKCFIPKSWKTERKTKVKRKGKRKVNKNSNKKMGEGNKKLKHKKDEKGPLKKEK